MYLCDKHWKSLLLSMYSLCKPTKQKPRALVNFFIWPMLFLSNNIGEFKQESNQITFRSCTLETWNCVVLTTWHTWKGNQTVNKSKQQIKGNLIRADFELITLNGNFCDLCESPTIELKVFWATLHFPWCAMMVVFYLSRAFVFIA